MISLWSLNETEALARRAARGAGLSWGHAEEAGRAVRWLCARGLPGAAALVSLLDWRDGRPEKSVMPRQNGQLWLPVSDRICPVALGSMLCDGQVDFVEGPLEIRDVCAPVLLVPFASWTAETERRFVAVEWPDTRIVLAPDGSVTGREPARYPDCADLQLCFEVEPEDQAIAQGHRAAIDATTISALTRLATRTYAPATEESRRSGAGAGLSDND